MLNQALFALTGEHSMPFQTRKYAFCPPHIFRLTLEKNAWIPRFKLLHKKYYLGRQANLSFHKGMLQLIITTPANLSNR